MADTKTETKDLINDLPVSAEAKKKLLAMLEAEGPTPDLMVEMRMALVDARIELDAANKTQLDELKKIDEDEQKQLDAAYTEYSKEMDELDEDAEELDKAVTKAMQDQEMEDTRKKIAGN